MDLRVQAILAVRVAVGEIEIGGCKRRCQVLEVAPLERNALADRDTVPKDEVMRGVLPIDPRVPANEATFGGGEVIEGTTNSHRLVNVVR